MPRRRLVTEQQVQFTAHGQVIVGRYISVEDVPFRDEKILKKYTLENEIGTMILMGSRKIDEAMAHCQIGDIVEITYLGTVPTSAGFSMNNYEVAVLEDDENGEEQRKPNGSGSTSK